MLTFKTSGNGGEPSIDAVSVKLISDPKAPEDINDYYWNRDHDDSSERRKFQKLGEASRQCASTGDKAVMTLIRAWLASDVVQRAYGPAEEDLLASTKPCRLLDLRGKKVRLTCIRKDRSCPRYATLSYVWGQTDFFKHTVETARVLEAGIPLTKFPPTFRDAIILCR